MAPISGIFHTITGVLLNYRKDTLTWGVFTGRQVLLKELFNYALVTKLTEDRKEEKINLEFPGQ